MKIEIVYATISGIPTNDTGGGNKIIHELIRSIDRSTFSRGFISYPVYRQFGSEPIPDIGPEMLPLRKRIGNFLTNSVPLYKSLVTSSWYFSWYRRRVDRFFRLTVPKIQCDIVHAHHPLVLKYFKNHPSKKILTIHAKGGYCHEMRKTGLGPSLYGAERFEELVAEEREAVLAADIVTFPSKAARDFFFSVNDIPVGDDRIRIVYNGVDVERIISQKPDNDIFRRYGIRQNAAMYILNVAEHIPQKNIAILINAVAAIRHSHGVDVHLINVGKGPLTDALTNMVRERYLEKSVSFLGHISNIDIIHLMKKCHCFVLTSVDVIFDLVIIEALACGLVVFVSNDGGNKEIIQDKVNGYLIDQYNPESIVNAIINHKTSSISNYAVQSALRFNVTPMTSHFENIYTEICQK